MSVMTYFTPVYNRAHTLPKLYESLLHQTNQNFVWLIVDDGSTDTTPMLVKNYISEGIIPITYIHQENCGKYVAHNVGVMNCCTDLFCCVDSDDYLIDIATERVLDTWAANKDDLSIVGIVSPRKLSDNSMFCTTKKRGTLDELYNKRYFKGDTMLVYRTKVLKDLLFPVYENEKFMSEGALYLQIDQTGELIYLNEHLYCTASYLDDGLSHNLIKHRYSSPKCTAYEFYIYAALRKSFVQRVKNYACYKAWTEVLGVEFITPRYQIGIIIRIGGLLLCKHYKLYFEREMKTL